MRPGRPGSRSKPSKVFGEPRAGCYVCTISEQGDALQVAAALIASEAHPESLEVVALDARLVVAAEREGLTIIEPEPGPSR
jgi:hypothetical protein